uniref:Calcineurin-like phosphoesterase domain-containing protein n=1 Tax=Periophthalmus magnuspinnatus TaxID=409849 RepID=A0A3B4BEP4_9GOBI
AKVIQWVLFSQRAGAKISPGRMWHITDLHLDPTYRLGPDPAHVCASSKGSPAVAPGVYGDYLCDAPYSLLSSALDHLSKMVSPEDFVIWTGSEPHSLFWFSPDLNLV